jgi:hypothetical protein
VVDLCRFGEPRAHLRRSALEDEPDEYGVRDGEQRCSEYSSEHRQRRLEERRNAERAPDEHEHRHVDEVQAVRDTRERVRDAREPTWRRRSGRGGERDHDGHDSSNHAVRPNNVAGVGMHHHPPVAAAGDSEGDKQQRAALLSASR